jgi:hypothetical protein
MLKKLTTTLMAAVVAVGLTLSVGSQQAEAGRGARTGALIGLGVLGALAVGAAAANAGPRTYYRSGCYRVAGSCYFKEGSCYINRFGEEVCRRGYRVCEPSRTVCD